ncbi:MAG TPA: urea transporter, partial [Pseudomonas sp.]|nr:urea transporter [Pseudomonas sp.]
LLQPLFKLLPVAGLTAPFVVACWVLDTVLAQHRSHHNLTQRL